MNDSRDASVDDADLLAWLDGRLDHARRVEIEALIAASPAVREVVFELALGPSSAFRTRFALGEPPASEALVDPSDYRLEGPLGGLRAAMGPTDDDAPPVYDTHGRVDLILRPGHRRADAPPAVLLVAFEDGLLERTPFAPAVAANGAMRVEAPARSLFSAAGRYTLALALDPGEVERFSGLTLSAARRLDPAVRWFVADCFFRADG